MDSIVDRVRETFPEADLDLVSQGAEALVFTANSYRNHRDEPVKTHCILKYRPSKRYRHPQLDGAITKQRTRGEAKVMKKLHAQGFAVPLLLHADHVRGAIWMSPLGYPLADGSHSSVKNWLWAREKLQGFDVKTVKEVLVAVGKIVGNMHRAGIVHGDLTTSNVVVLEEGVGLIDFGLASQKAPVEDRAVDLYVLERALASTHSRYAEQYAEWVMEGYGGAYGVSAATTTNTDGAAQPGQNGTGVENTRKVSSDGSAASTSPSEDLAAFTAVERRLNDVRQRGRKRSMLG